MRRTAIIALTILLTLTGCHKDGTSVQEAMDFRTRLMGAGECTFSADVTADYTERVYQFSMDCSYDPDGDTAALTITAPDTISGISAEVDGEAGTVAFADTSLTFGTMAAGRVSPLQLPRVLGNAWAQAYIDAEGKEEDGWLVTYRAGYDQEELVIDTWFTAQMTPARCEVYADDVCVLAAEIKNFSVS